MPPDRYLQRRRPTFLEDVHTYEVAFTITLTPQPGNEELLFRLPRLSPFHEVDKILADPSETIEAVERSKHTPMTTLEAKHIPVPSARPAERGSLSHSGDLAGLNVNDRGIQADAGEIAFASTLSTSHSNAQLSDDVNDPILASEFDTRIEDSKRRASHNHTTQPHFFRSEGMPRRSFRVSTLSAASNSFSSPSETYGGPYRSPLKKRIYRHGYFMWYYSRGDDRLLHPPAHPRLMEYPLQEGDLFIHHIVTEESPYYQIWGRFSNPYNSKHVWQEVIPYQTRRVLSGSEYVVMIKTKLGYEPEPSWVLATSVETARKKSNWWFPHDQ